VTWSRETSSGYETAKIRFELVQYTRGRGLDLGCGPAKGFPHFIGVDNNVDEQLFGHRATGADVIVPTCEKLDLFASDSMDFVFSSHLLEHIQDYKAALSEWWRVVKVGGHLVLYLPHKQFYPNVGQEGANPDHKHDFMPSDIVDAMKALGGWELLRNEDRNAGAEYSFFQVFRKRADLQQVYSLPKRPKKAAAVVRYGGIGDMLQAASVLPGLKAQGYHITFYTHPFGQEIVKHDPNIDAFYIQDTDQVPNAALGEFFKHEAKKYDRFVNLCESVEGNLLALPGRSNYEWPHDVRGAYFSRNYLEFTHDLAGVPHRFKHAFHPTKEETARAKNFANKHGRFIAWSLSGSSLHKAWPYTDAVIARLLLADPDIKVALMGDATCQILEQGWENEPRVIRMCGRLPIRDSLTLIEHAVAVVGPETGLLNAAGMLDVPKALMLSHSSRENLPKHWKATTVLEPKNVPCFPCHRMHYGWDNCKKDEETHAAMCQARITPDQVWAALCEVLQWQQAAA